QSLKISSMCATFAETEVISLLAEGQSKADILGGVHAAVATRTVGLVGRAGRKGPIVMTGGVARDKAAGHYREQAPGELLVLPETPRTAAALGAALIGLDDSRREHPQALEDDDALEAQMALDKACVPELAAAPSLSPSPLSPPP